VKKIDYIKELNLAIIHSYRKCEIYFLTNEFRQQARKVQELVFEEDVNVFKRFAFNEGELIFAYGKTVCYFTWSEDV